MRGFLANYQHNFSSFVGSGTVACAFRKNAAPTRVKLVKHQLGSTVTSCCERRGTKHRRHLRNVSTRSGVQSPAQSSSHQSNLNTPSLPALTPSPGTTTTVADTWDDVNANDNNNDNNNDAIPSARRPAIDTRSSPRDRRPPANGPPPPPSWLNPNRRQRNAQPSASGSRSTTRTTVLAREEPPSMRGAGVSKKERKRRREEEAMDKAYGGEYWYKRADDGRWTEWREEAMSLVLGRVASNHQSEELQRSSRTFVPFKVAHDCEGIPSLFEMTLKYICESITSEESKYDDDIMVDVFSSVPPHIRRRLLRYLAVHHPPSESQLRQIYALSREGSLIPDQGGLEPEIILSGKHLDAGILDRLNQPPTSNESTMQATSVSLLQEAKSIILFQITSLQKRQLVSFPKTLTTLGLIAIPTPLSPKERLEQLNGLINKTSKAGRKKAQASAATGSGPSETEVSLPPRPTTSSSVISTLVSLPELFPSLVTLDVSYNPWMIEGWTMTDVRGAPPLQVPNYGLLGRWDLRLWGRMKTLGVRGCFKVSRHHKKSRCSDETTIELSDGMSNMQALLNAEAPALFRELKDVAVPNGSPQPWIAHWDRELYSVGRPIDIQWREETCRSPEPSPHIPLPSTSNVDPSE
ncbi:hypothetical protein CPB86DRAFT_834461 [Serendipita vermifera]|nr:hypothetical protein CPB86DRAFT_834461 [Serendipita vermifera]